MKQSIEVEALLLLNFQWSKVEKLFHFLGRLDNVNGVGLNNLIKKGAILVTSPEDIIAEIPELQNLNSKVVQHNTLIKKEYRKIYNILSDIPISLDEISIKTQNSVKCTLNLLSLMELEDIIDEIPGARLCQKIQRVKIR